MLGNPQLNPGGNTPDETRFKMWWHMVGSAVENAARKAVEQEVAIKGLEGFKLSFKGVFARGEAKDEAREARAAALQALRRFFTKKDEQGKEFIESFKAGKVFELLGASASSHNIRGGGAEDPDVSALRGLCMPKDKGLNITAVSAGRGLSALCDAPTVVPDGILTLRSNDPSGSNSRWFHLELRKKKPEELGNGRG